MKGMSEKDFSYRGSEKEGRQAGQKGKPTMGEGMVRRRRKLLPQKAKLIPFLAAWLGFPSPVPDTTYHVSSVPSWWAAPSGLVLSSCLPGAREKGHHLAHHFTVCVLRAHLFCRAHHYRAFRAPVWIVRSSRITRARALLQRAARTRAFCRARTSRAHAALFP